MKKYEVEKFSSEELREIAPTFTLDKKTNPVVTETAGFVPLAVKFKQFEQNGIIAQFRSDEFTSSDLQEIYLNPDLEITPYDDYETVNDKLAMQNEIRLRILDSKSQGEDAKLGDSGTESPSQKSSSDATISKVEDSEKV